MSKKPIIVKTAHLKSMLAANRKRKLKLIFDLAGIPAAGLAAYGFYLIILFSYPHNLQSAAIKGDALPDAEYMDISGIDRGGISDEGIEYFPPEYEVAAAKAPIPREMPEWIKEQREFKAQLKEALSTKGAE